MTNILDPRKWATGPVTSDMYGPSQRTLQDWAKRDLIVSITIGRIRYYSLESLDELYARTLAEQPKYTPRRVPWNVSPAAPHDGDPINLPSLRKSKPRAPVRRRRPSRASADLITST